jgi:hypothetical protein
MKKLLFLSLLALNIQINAQNVGIGTPNPLGKLQINTQSTSWNFPSLLLTDDATDNSGGAILQFRNPADKRMYLQSHFGTMANGSDTYMTFSHDATYNMRIRGDGNVGIGNLNPNLAGLVVDKKVGNVQAMFGSNTSGVSIESNFPSIHFNSYFNGSRKTIITGYTAGAEMDPTTGTFNIYTSPTTTPIGNTASVFNRLSIDKDGDVGIGNTAAAEKLDVTGNINVTGTIKANGVAGTAGQILTTSGSTLAWTNLTIPATTYVIGDFAQGGVVFWVSPNGQHGKVISIYDSGEMPWSNISSLIGTSANSFKNGAGNTVAITQQNGHTNSAAKHCAEFSYGGYDDWFLPSQGDLDEIYGLRSTINIKSRQNNGEEFGDSAYWSSTEITATTAYIRYLTLAATGSSPKGSNYVVRPIRAF